MAIKRKWYLHKLVKLSLEAGDNCVIFTGAKHEGYGQVTIKNKKYSVHTIVYEAITGIKIPEGFELDHSCFNRACFSFKHLEPVTRRINNERMTKHKLNKRNERWQQYKITENQKVVSGLL